MNMRIRDFSSLVKELKLRQEFQKAIIAYYNFLYRIIVRLEKPPLTRGLVQKDKLSIFICLETSDVSSAKLYILWCRVKRDHLADSSSGEAESGSVDLRRLELLTSSLQMRRTTSCAIGPNYK